MAFTSNAFYKFINYNLCHWLMAVAYVLNARNHPKMCIFSLPPQLFLSIDFYNVSVTPKVSTVITSTPKRWLPLVLILFGLTYFLQSELYILFKLVVILFKCSILSSMKPQESYWFKAKMKRSLMNLLISY